MLVRLQIAIQLDFSVQCCKQATVARFKDMGGMDKSPNMWWNVYVQFQTKVLDSPNGETGIPWQAADLFAPLNRKVSPTPTRARGLSLFLVGRQ